MAAALTPRKDWNSVTRSAAILLASALLTVGGCAATKRAHVRASLQDAGLSEADARCLAPPLVAGLSTSELKSLKKISALTKGDQRPASEAELLATLHENLDEKTVTVVLDAVSHCFMTGL